MNRIIVVILIVSAIAMHFVFCEWQFPDELRQVAQSQYDRTIYFRGSDVHRKTTFADNVFLMAKPSSNREEAQIWGVLMPAVLIGGAMLIFHVWKGREESSI